MNYELKHIRGIPYYLNGATVHIFELDGGRPAATAVAIGTYDAVADNIAYYDDWRERVQSNLTAFRASLTTQERDKLRESIVRPQKQRKVARAPRKTTARTKSAKSE